MAKNKITKIEINGNMLLVNDEDILAKERNVIPYASVIKTEGVTENTVEAGDYTVIAIHGYNPGCYKYLDYAAVIKRTTGESRIVKLWRELNANDSYGHYDTEAKLNRLTVENGKVYAYSQQAKVEICVDNIFKPVIEPGYSYSPELDEDVMSTCFDYKVMKDNAILMTLKPELPMTKFLEWHGFNMDYNAFKFWGSIFGYGQSYLMFANTNTGNSWTVDYGNSTTMTSGEVWQRRDELLNCILEQLPTHSSCYEQAFTKVQKAA